MLRTPNSSIKNIKVVCGCSTIEQRALDSFSDNAIAFLDEVSTVIRNNKNLNSYTDIKTFGFWCRKKNLMKIKLSLSEACKSIGRGIVFHVAPSNVALTFAYSLAFGLLAGNVNIVRVPSRKFEQVRVFLDIVDVILRKTKHRKIRSYISLVQYDRSDSISKAISAISDARLIWGGDATIQNFKNYATKPRCLDLTFSDRYSIALMNPSEMKDLTDAQLSKIVQRFFNDAYLMDQRGCSSPQCVIWNSHHWDQEKTRFWASLTKFVGENYDHDISTAAEKLFSISHSAINSRVDFKALRSDFRVVRLRANEIKNFDTVKCEFGTFLEASIANLDELNEMINDRFQTIAYFGVSRRDIENAIFKDDGMGVDRIVPIGRAFDMGHVWDGYNVIKMLSRTIGD